MTRTCILLAAAFAVVIFDPAPAGAVDCSTLPNVLIGTGGSANQPTIKQIGIALAGRTDADKITIVYKPVNGCVGIYSLLNNEALNGTGGFYWDATGAEFQCDFTGQLPDFANLATSTKLCPLAPDPLPADIGDYVGTNVAVSLFVPLASSQRSISAAAAYFVFGFGAAGQAAPWVVDNEITIRDPNAAVQQVLGTAIGVPSSKFLFGVNSGGNGPSVTRVAGSTNPEAAIGFASAQTVDTKRNLVRTLAYQHTGQTCGYLPDSSETTFDKRNVREGRYFLWSGQHWWVKKNATSGAIVNPLAAKLIGWLTGTVALPTGFDLLGIQIKAGEIPSCAMKVAREGDLGKIFKKEPTKACHGYFGSLTGGTTAKACPNGPSDCTSSAPACNYGYCEVK